MTENNSEDLKNLLKLIDEDGLGLQEKVKIIYLVIHHLHGLYT